MKKGLKISIITLIISLIGVSSFLGISYFKYDGKVSSIKNTLNGQISNSGLFLTDDNTVRDYSNKIIKEDIKFMNEDGLMISTDGSLIGYPHIKRVKDVMLNYYIDSDDNLYTYSLQTKRLLEKNVKLIEPIKVNGINQKGIVALTKANKLILFSDEEDTTWFKQYKKSLTIGQKLNITKIFINYETRYNQETIENRLIYTLFENGQLLKTTINKDNELKKEFVHQNIKIKDFIPYKYKISDYSYQTQMYILSDDNKVYNSLNFIFPKEDKIDSWVDVQGIYVQDNILYGVKKDHTIYSSASIEGVNILDVEKLYDLDYIVAKGKNGDIFNLNYETKYKELLDDNIIDLSLNKSTNEYAYIKNDNTGWYYNGESLKQIDGKFKSLSTYDDFFFFVTTEGNIKSTYRFSNTTLTSQENVQDHEYDVIVYKDGKVSTLNKDEKFINYVNNLSAIKDVSFDKRLNIYSFKTNSGKLHLYSLLDGDVEKLVSFPSDNDWNFIYCKLSSKSYLFYSEKENKNYVITYDNIEKKYVLNELDFEHQIIEMLYYNYGDTISLTTEGRLIKNFNFNNPTSDNHILFGIKLLDTSN